MNSITHQRETSGGIDSRALRILRCQRLTLADRDRQSHVSQIRVYILQVQILRVQLGLRMAGGRQEGIQQLHWTRIRDHLLPFFLPFLSMAIPLVI